jgi:hypothetical protein
MRHLRLRLDESGGLKPVVRSGSARIPGMIDFRKSSAGNTRNGRKKTQPEKRPCPPYCAVETKKDPDSTKESERGKKKKTAPALEISAL